MKKILIPVILYGLLFTACKSDNQKKLAALKKKHQELTLQISRLEEAMARESSDTTVSRKGKWVQVQELRPVVFNHYIEVQGRIDGDENVPVISLSGGKIQSIYVSAGQRVSKGQLLAKMDDAVLQESLSQLKSNLAFVTDIYEKKKRLWEQKVGSEIDYLTAKNNKENIEKNIAQVQEQIKMMHFESPVNGTVEEINIKAGQTIVPGYPAFRVISFNKIKAVADVSESYASKVGEGDRIIISLPDIHKEFSAVVNHASDYINPTNRSFTIEAYLTETDASLKANMVAVIKINDYHKDNSIVIPLNLVQNDQRNGDYVLIAREKDKGFTAHRAYIKTGIVYNGQTEVLDGLKPGDKIITAGFQSLEEGQFIRY